MESAPIVKKDQETEFFTPTTLRLLIIVFLFVTALGIRLYKITDPPLDFHAMRQYHSLIITRGFYFENLTTIPKWRKQLAKD